MVFLASLEVQATRHFNPFDNVVLYLNDFFSGFSIEVFDKPEAFTLPSSIIFNNVGRKNISKLFKVVFKIV